MKSVKERMGLLEPGPHVIKVERYMLGFRQLPDLGGDLLRFEAKPDVVFRPDRVLCAAGLPMSEWHKFLLKWFSWVKLPWLRVEKFYPDEDPEYEDDGDEREGLYDDDEPHERFRFRWLRPIVSLVERSMQRAQARVLKGCLVMSIRIGETELIIGGGLPLDWFSPLAVGMQLDAPTCYGDRIIIETTKTTAPLTFSMVGTAPESARSSE